MDVQGCAGQNESRIDGVHEKLDADEDRPEVLVRLDLSCSFEAADLRAQFRHVRHKGGDDDEVMQLWIHGQGSNAERTNSPERVQNSLRADGEDS